MAGGLDRYSDAIDDYIDSVIVSTTYRVADQDEELDSRITAYFTGSNLTRSIFLATSILAVATAIWHMLYLVGVDHPYLSGVRFSITHFLLMGLVIFLSTISHEEDTTRRRLHNVATALVLAGLVVSAAYVFLNWDVFHSRAGAPNQMDIVISTIIILVTLEGARRVVGLPFLLLGVLALLYGVYGNYVPGTLGHSGMSWARLAAGAGVPNVTVGVFGFFMDLSARLITIFIFFGIFLLHLGGSEYFGDFAMKIAGRLRSGPAQVAIISSGFMGMLSGSAIANVAATGSFSIPLMKRLGYDKNFAGAIESVASTGGQITPPIMGATAFVMAAIIGVPYFEVLVAAAIPALLYYTAIMLTAHIRAVKLGFQPIDAEEQVSLGSLLVRSYLFVPILVIVLVLAEGQPAEIGGWRGLQALVALYAAHMLLVNRDTLVEGAKTISVTLFRASDSAARSMAAIMIVIAELAWIIEIFQMTGVLQAIASSLLMTAETFAAVVPVGGELLILAIMSAAIGIIFGFGTPSIVAYLIVALIAAPAMAQVGVEIIGAHMFVFYFAILSAISPPVAGACLVACGISQGSFLRTAAYAMRFAFPAYLMPFLWIYEPALIAQGTIPEIAIAFAAVFIGILVLVSAFEDFLLVEYRVYERILAFVVAFGMFVPDMTVKLGATALFVVVLASHLPRYLDERSTPIAIPWT